MRRQSLICAFVALMGVLFALPNAAFAQDGASVVILKFEKMDASDEVVRVLEASLAEGIEAHDDMHVKKGGEVTIKDLALTAGCDTAEAECMESLRDFVDADRVVFGSVQASEDVYLFSMKMFDFAEGRYVAEVTDQTVEGDVSRVKKVIPALVDNFIYGDVGVVVVEVTGADSPDIIFDGEKVGLAPTRLENLPLGEHVVSVKTADGEEDTRTVVLRADEPVTVTFAFESDTSTNTKGLEPDSSGEGPSAVPGWVSIGIGVVGLAVGGFSSFQVVKASDDNAALADEGFVDPDTGGLIPGEKLAEGTDRADSIRTRGKTYQTLQYIGYGVGGVGVALGTVLLIRAMGGSEKDTSGAASNLDFGVAPSRDGVSATLRLRF